MLYYFSVDFILQIVIICLIVSELRFLPKVKDSLVQKDVNALEMLQRKIKE